MLPLTTPVTVQLVDTDSVADEFPVTTAVRRDSGAQPIAADRG